MILPGLFGYQRYVITSGSMTGTYDRGSVVFADVVPVSDLRVGDVITYTPPPGSGPDGLVTIASPRSDVTSSAARSSRPRVTPTRRPTLDVHPRRGQPGPRRLPPSLRRLRPLRPLDPGGADDRDRHPALLIAFAVLVGFRREVRQAGSPRRAAREASRPLGVLAVAALLAAGITFSGATFIAAAVNPGNDFTASNAFNLSATMDNPGANLRSPSP